jgi:WD40 repeat protein
VFLADGKTLASAGQDHAVRLWEAGMADRPVSTCCPADDYFPSSRFTPDGSTLAWLDGSRIGQLNVATGKRCVRSTSRRSCSLHLVAGRPAPGRLRARPRCALWTVLREGGASSRRRTPRSLRRCDLLELAFAPDGRMLAVGLETDDNGRTPWGSGHNNR